MEPGCMLLPHKTDVGGYFFVRTFEAQEDWQRMDNNGSKTCQDIRSENIFGYKSMLWTTNVVKQILSSEKAGKHIQVVPSPTSQ